MAWIVAAVRVEAGVRESLPEFGNLSYQGWRRLGLREVILPEMDRLLREDQPPTTVAAEFTYTAVHQHLQIAWSRFQGDLRRDVALITSEGSRWFSRAKSFSGGRTASRLREALGWTQLKLLGENGLTTDGEQVLARALLTLSEGAGSCTPVSSAATAHFHKALLLTYSFDSVFFEQVVLSDLWAGRTSDILVIGDGDQVKSAIQDAVGRLWHLGKKYVLGSAGHAGSFHPKMLLRLGATEGAVMIGSGNLTSCGWGGNQELGSAWTLGPSHADNGAWVRPFLDDVISWCASDLEKNAVRRMKDLPWLGVQSPNLPLPAPFLYSSNNCALAPFLAEQWKGRKFSEVRIFTGSTDAKGPFLRWAHDTFGVERAVIALTPSQASFSLDKLADLPLELRLIHGRADAVARQVLFL